MYPNPGKEIDMCQTVTFITFERTAIIIYTIPVIQLNSMENSQTNIVGLIFKKN